MTDNPRDDAMAHLLARHKVICGYYDEATKVGNFAPAIATVHQRELRGLEEAIANLAKP